MVIPKAYTEHIKKYLLDRESKSIEIHFEIKAFHFMKPLECIGLIKL